MGYRNFPILPQQQTATPGLFVVYTLPDKYRQAIIVKVINFYLYFRYIHLYRAKT